MDTDALSVPEMRGRSSKSQARAPASNCQLRIAAQVERISAGADSTEARFEQALVGLGLGKCEFEPAGFHEERQSRIVELNPAQSRARRGDTQIHIDFRQITKLERLLASVVLGGDDGRHLGDDRIERELGRR